MQEVIPKELIEKALTLTGKGFDEVMEVVPDWWWYDFTSDLSIEKFCYYLISPEFISQYENNVFWTWFHEHMYRVVWYFWNSIYEYQKWNAQPLINLLYKI